MGILNFFHKIKTGFIRMKGTEIPYTCEEKRYGDDGEDEFTYTLKREIPSCKIKKNVVITTPEGNAEIDCVVLYKNKLFAIEIKRWKGYITETDEGFLQEKEDRWTNELHTKRLRSPFRQLRRAIYLLRKQIPVNAWVNDVVFFENDELEGIEIFSDNVWFDHYGDVIDYIVYNGKTSFGSCASAFFDKCVPYDTLHSKHWGDSLNCIVDRENLKFRTPQGPITGECIDSIYIKHHWSYDELHVNLTTGTEQTIILENGQILVYENGYKRSYSFSKLDCIKFGKAY